MLGPCLHDQLQCNHLRAFHIDNVGYFVQVPVHGIHGKAEHEHGEGSAHVNPLSYDSVWEELASDFV